MPTECEIKFDSNPNGVYYSGQTLLGHVELRLDNPKKVKNLKLIISGCAEVKWTKSKIKRKKNGADVSRMRGLKRETYLGKEEFISSEIALIPRVNDDAIEIPAGTHEYKFSCQIPPQAATSFEGDHGKVRYTVRAVLDRPWKFDQTCTIAFTVLHPLDLNQEVAKLGLPKTIDRSRNFWFWPCVSGPMSFSIEIPVNGYVSGQKIPITVKLNNASNVPIRGIRSKLVRKVNYISQAPVRKTTTVTKTVAKLLTAVPDDKSSEYTQDLVIPATAPTGVCSVLTVNYELKVRLKLGSFRSNQEYTIPITIGTVPFSTASRTSVPPPVAPAEDAMNTSGFGWSGGMPMPSVASSSASPSSLPLLPNAQSSPKPPPYPISPAPPAIGFLPPSYQEAMNQSAVNMNDGVQNALGFQAYIPRYPVYNFGSPVRM